MSDLAARFLANTFVGILQIMVRLIMLSFILLCFSCNHTSTERIDVKDNPSKKTLDEPMIWAKPLLASRFKSLDDFKSKVQVKYFNKPNDPNSKVQLKVHDKKTETLCELKSGLSQNDILKAKNGSLWDKVKFTLKCPYAIRNRKDLEKVFKLARKRKLLFGVRDVAFYDLALILSQHIDSDEQAFKNAKDSSEKGYINTFNHVTAQAIITSIFTKKLASFMADAHERKNMPELTTGNFTPEQLQDTMNYPEDNYTDVINNKIGQEIGLVLKKKYNLNTSTLYTPELLTNYLNDLQNYFSRSMGIGFRPFNSNDEVIVRFVYKLNHVLRKPL